MNSIEYFAWILIICKMFCLWQESEAQKQSFFNFRRSEEITIKAEVPDPYYGTMQDFENVYNMLNVACDVIAEKYKLINYSKN